MDASHFAINWVIYCAVLCLPFNEDLPHHVKRNGTEVELRTLDYENPGTNIVLRC